MSDVARPENSAKRRARNRGRGPVMLREAGIEFEMKNRGAHLVVGNGRADFWPGTGLWHVRNSAIEGRGVKKLIKHLLADTPAAAVVCDYCGKPALLVGGDLVYPHRADLHALTFWQCAPCGAYVGCHPAAQPKRGGIGDGTVPMGRLANQELRVARGRVHRVFDQIWEHGEGHFSDRRRRAYVWLAGAMGMPVPQCHVGDFDLPQCAQALRLCRERQS